MDHFDLTDVGTWEGEEVAGEPADLAWCAPGALRLDALAPGGDAWAPLGQRPSRPPAGPSLAPISSDHCPCISMKDIYEHYQELVRSRLRRSDVEPAVAEEIHQEVFLTMNRLFLQDGLRLPDNLGGMLATITENLICNHLRRYERRLELADEVELDEVPASRLDLEQRAERKEIVEIVLTKLPREAAMLILCIDFGQQTQAEVATALERPLKTVKTQHLRARAKFRDLLERVYGVDLGPGA